jgi:chemotaxis-related protein WspB
MLFLVFKLGNDRYALDASRVVEVVPLLSLKQMPQAPPGFAGIFNYRGKPVPALDLCQLTLGRPSREQLSTRIIILAYTGKSGAHHLLGLIAENATEMLRKQESDFMDPGISLPNAPYLGPVLMEKDGAIQRIFEQQLLSESTQSTVFEQTAAVFA